MWRLYAGLGLAALAVAALLFVRHIVAENRRLETGLDAATAQASLNLDAGTITERVVRSEVTITQKAERAADDVRSLPGADAPLDPGFGVGLADSLRRMRAPGATSADPGE